MASTGTSNSSLLTEILKATDNCEQGPLSLSGKAISNRYSTHQITVLFLYFKQKNHKLMKYTPAEVPRLKKKSMHPVHSYMKTPLTFIVTYFAFEQKPVKFYKLMPHVFTFRFWQSSWLLLGVSRISSLVRLFIKSREASFASSASS